MARVTVEDCIKQIPNRFQLVVLASQRARDISSGAPLTLAQDNDKNPVVSLREIAAGNLDADALWNAQVINQQKNNKVDEVPDENLYAEAQEITIDADYSDSDTLESSFSIDEENDLEMDFADNIGDEDKD